jgi:hypothetical protein
MSLLTKNRQLLRVWNYWEAEWLTSILSLRDFEPGRLNKLGRRARSG